MADFDPIIGRQRLNAPSLPRRMLSKKGNACPVSKRADRFGGMHAGSRGNHLCQGSTMT